MQARFLLFVISLALLNSGCALPPKPLWRAGASRAGFEENPRGMPKAPEDVAVYLKRDFSLGEPTEARRHFACSTTTVLRKAFLLPGAAEAPPPPRGDWEPVAYVTTEEYPRDEERSWLREPPSFGQVLGLGTTPMDLFEVRLDERFLPDALDRLRHYAALLGADAVVDVYATGEAEYHGWKGFGLGFDVRTTRSLLYLSGELLDFRLRDVRLHGLAVRRAE